MPSPSKQLGVFLLAVATVGGCLGPRRDDYRSFSTVTVADPSPQADRHWDAVLETLRRHHFTLDRVDRRAGVITTMPEVSQHFFEVWRHDVDTDADLLTATLNPLRRWVKVRVARDADGSWSRIDVEVRKERLSSPDRQFNNSGAAYQFFGTTLPSTTGEVELTPEHDRWLDIGRDAPMEDYLLGKILALAREADVAE